MTKSKLQKSLLLVFLLVTSIVVGFIFKNFFMVILLAATTAALVYIPFKKLEKKFKGRSSLAAFVVLVFVILGALLPLGLVLGMFTSQAITISQKVTPLVQEQIRSTESVDKLLLKLPYGETIVEYQTEILTKIGGAIQGMSSFLVGKLSAVTLSAVNFIFLTFLYLYTLFFLIRDGQGFLTKLLYYLPFEDSFEQQLLNRFVSITRATLKGTLLIGLIQGSIAGLALWFFGIANPLFWTVIMVILSVIPLIGTPLVWIPAGIFLIVTGQVGAGIALLVFCGVVVSNIDNILRPIFIGQDTKMHELLVLFATLGGLSLFGVAGFVIGPIVVGLWVTLWEVYGETFKAYLPDVTMFRTVEVAPVIENSEEQNDTTSQE